MKLFFHHVSQMGANEDFKQAVYKDIGVETIENDISISPSYRDDLPKDQT